MSVRDIKYDKVNERIYNDCLPLLFPDFDPNKVNQSGGGYSSDIFQFRIPPSALYSATSKYNYSESYFEHFTSLKSLISILNSNKLRMYNMVHLKDSSEFLHATPKELHNKLSIRKKKIYIISGVNTTNMIDYEQFNLWEKYGEQGFGAKLKFEFDFTRLANHFGDVFLKQVVYEKLQLNSFLRAIEKIENEEDITIEYGEILDGAGILHKHPQYTLEREVRLAFFNETVNDSINITTKLDSNYFEDYSYSSKKVSKYRNLHLNDENETVGVKLIGVELGYKHKSNSDIYSLINNLCFVNHRIYAGISKLENI